MYQIMLPAQEAFDLLGHGNIGLILLLLIFRAETPNCRRESEVFFEGETKWERNVLHTPKGDLTELRVFEPAFDSSTAGKHFVESVEDYERLWSYLEDVVILENYDQYYRDRAELGDDGIPKTEIERTPGSSSGSSGGGCSCLYHLADWRARRAYPRPARTSCPADLRVACRSPAPLIVIVDNITVLVSAGVISQILYSSYDELDAMLADRGIPVFSHMDGMLKPLWKDIARSRVGGLDSFTPTPDCDTTVVEAVAMRPEKRPWLNFPLLGPSGAAGPDSAHPPMSQSWRPSVTPAACKFRFRRTCRSTVGRSVFPVIVEAIEAFGKP